MASFNSSDLFERLPASILSGSGSPVGVVFPDHVDQLYIQVESDRVVHWISTGVTNNDWMAIGGSAIQKANSDPNEAPAFTGQIWQNVIPNSLGIIGLNSVWMGLNPSGAADTTSWIQIATQ